MIHMKGFNSSKASIYGHFYYTTTSQLGLQSEPMGKEVERFSTYSKFRHDMYFRNRFEDVFIPTSDKLQTEEYENSLQDIL